MLGDLAKADLDQTLELVKKRAEILKIKDIIVASSTGFTALKALEKFEKTDITLTIVSVDRQWWDDSFRDILIRNLKERGHRLCFMKEESNYPFIKTPLPFIRVAYSRLSTGVWIAVEATFFAVDTGLVSTDRDVIAIGDHKTALLIKPSRSENFDDFKIKEIICM